MRLGISPPGVAWRGCESKLVYLDTFLLLYLVSALQNKSLLFLRSINMEDLPQCLPFNGTSDFYGLGIRVGVYLQLASSHITNTLNQEAAPANYAANSVFVFAIIVALLNAANATPSEIRPVEAWIMLQICLSFFFTTLGLFGVRCNDCAGD